VNNYEESAEAAARKFAAQLEEAIVTIAALHKQLAEAKAVIERLPKTKDGVPVTPGMSVWVDHGSDAYEEDRYEEGQWWPDESCDIYGDGEYIALVDCYSAREAAVADRGEQK